MATTASAGRATGSATPASSTTGPSTGWFHAARTSGTAPGQALQQPVASALREQHLDGLRAAADSPQEGDKRDVGDQSDGRAEREREQCGSEAAGFRQAADDAVYQRP